MQGVAYPPSRKNTFIEFRDECRKLLGKHFITLRLPQALKDSYETCQKRFAATFSEKVELPSDVPIYFADIVSLLAENAKSIARKNLGDAARSVLRRDVAFRICDSFPMCYH
jgi:hypothetical protein